MQRKCSDCPHSGGVEAAVDSSGDACVWASVSMDNFKEGFNHGRPSESHSWEFETMLMRLLYFAGAIDVCNT